uniref:T9SS type A sorting domain-containing protein n=1 Tax=candidate division WOR-3 bacterium TaxID=2052148 RepID=A0A7V0Z6Y0_UNCW3
MRYITPFMLFFMLSFGFIEEIPIKLDPNIPKLTKKFVQDNLDISLFAKPAAGAGMVWESLDSAFNGLFFVTDHDWNRIVFTDINSNWIKAYGSFGSDPGQFWHPAGIDVDKSGRVFIADSWNARIIQLQYDFNLDTLEFTAEIKTIGPVTLDLPLGLCIDDNGTPELYNDDYLFIADAGANRIIKMRIADKSFVYKYGDVGISHRFFSYPRAIAKGQMNGANNSRLYVVDYCHQAIVLMHDYGDSVKWVTSRKISGRSNKFLSVCTDFYGNVYVAELDSCRVVKFDPDLTTYQTFGSYGIGTNKFNHLFYFTVPRRSLNGFAIESWADSSGIKQFKLGYGIESLSTDTTIFDATEESLVVSISVNAPARVTIKVSDTTIIRDRLLKTGIHTFIWDGRNKDSKIALPGNYQIIAEAYGTGGVFWYDTRSTSVTVKGTRVSGTLSPNEHWTEEGEPYVLTGDVEMANQSNSKLVIDPGVKVMPTGNYGITHPVYWTGGSTICAKGSPINKILFTPHRKLYPQPDSFPKGFWKGIVRRTNDTSLDSLIFDHCIIENAGSESAAIWLNKTPYVLITNTKISKSGGFGFYCTHYNSTVNIINCEFEDTDSVPLFTNFRSIGEIYGNKFINNSPNVIAITGGTRETDATIYNQGVPYWFLKGFYWECNMKGTSTYCPTLLIQPGVKILFSDSCGLYALSRSKIIAIGKPESIITFTALDTTRHWRGIHINNSHPADTSRFEYCDISYGGRFLTYPLDAGVGNLALSDNKGAFVLKNSRIARSMSYGVGDAHNFETDTCISLVQDNIFYANDSFPLIISTTELGECKGNQFIDNRRQGILIRGGGDITKPITMRNQGVPSVIDCEFMVNNLLEIEKGNVLQFKNNRARFKSNGILKAKKTTFTAYDILWDGIKFENSRSDTSILDSCIIEKARAIGGSAVHISNSRVRVSNSAIMNNECGIYVGGASSRLIVKNNGIYQNNTGIRAFDVRPESLFIKYNEFLGNRCAFMTNYVYPYIPADSNWWGDATGPWDPSTGAPDYNPSGRGDSIGDYVIYRPWLTEPVQLQVVTLLQPNGGETLYCGQEYEIVWSKAIGGKRGQLEAIKWNKSEIRSTKYETNSNDEIPISQMDGSGAIHRTDEILKQVQGMVQNETPTPSLSHQGRGRFESGLSLQGRGGKGQSQILRQELYYTTDFPEGGSKAETFWKFIDTVPVGETSYVWQVPNTPSNRCRVAIKIYYELRTGSVGKKEMGRQRDEEIKGIRLSGNQDIRNKYDGCAIGVDISDGNFAIGLATDFSLSTAYNQGKKILTSPTGNKVHFVYANEGLILPSGVFYCYSQDSGKTFISPELVDSSGLYPAMSLDPNGNPCASWVSGSDIYFTYWTSSWAPPDTIVLPVENLSPPSMVCDNKDTVHLLYVQYYQLPSDTGDLVYLKFKRTDFEGAVKETLHHHIFCRFPSLALDELRNIHILWQGENCVCYQRQDSTGWSDVDTIYTTTTNERLYPVIDVYGNKIVGAWQDRDGAGDFEIYSRRKIDTGWEEIKKVAQTLGDSKFPVLANANYCLWQDNSEGNWEVYKSEYVDTAGTWLEPENISNTLTQSSYPHCAYALVNGTIARLHILWTEGDTIPYPIEFKRIEVLPVAKVFVDVGKSIQSSYCLQRDGYWVFGDRPYQTTDWGYENLRYRISGLDLRKDYRLDLAYYFRNEAIEGNLGQLGAIKGSKSEIRSTKSESSSNDEIPISQMDGSGAIHRTDEILKSETLNLIQGKVQDDKYEPDRPEGIGRIIQALVIDGVGLDTAFITPNHLRRISVWLPDSVYKDGEIIIEIKKIKGKRVVCSEIGLYEFPKEEKEKVFSGPMGKEASISRPFLFEQIYPNPAKGVLRIRFNSPDERKIIIKLYDVCGRLVHQKNLLKSKIGMNELLIKPECLPAGVYFVRLEAEGYTKTEKAILLK